MDACSKKNLNVSVRGNQQASSLTQTNPFSRGVPHSVSRCQDCATPGGRHKNLGVNIADRLLCLNLDVEEIRLRHTAVCGGRLRDTICCRRHVPIAALCCNEQVLLRRIPEDLSHTPMHTCTWGSTCLMCDSWAFSPMSGFRKNSNQDRAGTATHRL